MPTLQSVDEDSTRLVNESLDSDGTTTNTRAGRVEGGKKWASGGGLHMKLGSVSLGSLVGGGNTSDENDDPPTAHLNHPTTSLISHNSIGSHSDITINDSHTFSGNY